MSNMIDLEPCNFIKRRGWGYERMTAARKSLPFAESVRGAYTHRVRHVTLYANKDCSHFAVTCWCGYTIHISKKKFGRLVEEPSQYRPMCATCEGRAIGAGLLGAREIAGRSVMYRPMGAAS